METAILEVAAGKTAILKCSSNDPLHNFLFWQLGQDKILGPGNDLDESKYKYEVLSGKLFIRNVAPRESGFYSCISKNINGGNLNIGTVNMIVNQDEQFQRMESFDDGLSEIDIAKIICIVIALIVLMGCFVVFFNFRKEEKKRRARLLMLGEDEDDDGSGDEIYNRTTTSATAPRPGPSKPSAESITGIDNQGLDTDFNSVFEQIAINVSNRNLI